MGECINLRQLFFALIFFLYGMSAHSTGLQKVEQVALDTSPELAELRSKEQALLDAAVAAGQLPDPVLHGGIINVPTDSFSLTQENMTQIKIGIVQTFPKGRSL